MNATWIVGLLLLAQHIPLVPPPGLGAPRPSSPEYLPAPTPVLGAATDTSQPQRVWVGVDYMEVGRGTRSPPLVTSGTGAANPGVLGQPGTQTLFGNQRLPTEYLSGIRGNVGFWLTCEQTCSIESSFFYLPASTTAGGVFTNNGQPPISRPFINAITGRPDAQLVTLPGVVGGSVAVNTETGPFIGADLLFRKKLCGGCNYRLDALFGYRFLYFQDHLDVTENLLTLDPAATPTTFRVHDSFTATNAFHGIDLGLAGSFWWKCLALDLRARVALGNVHRDVDINGFTATTVAGSATVVNQGGLLALSSNIGRHRADQFAVVPEVGVGLSCQITRNLRARVNYNVLYWPDVARAGDQIDLVVNPNLIPPPIPGGPARPAFLGNTDSLWLHSLSLGFEFRY